MGANTWIVLGVLALAFSGFAIPYGFYLRGESDKAPAPKPSVSAVSHGQKGGITANTVSIENITVIQSQVQTKRSQKESGQSKPDENEYDKMVDQWANEIEKVLHLTDHKVVVLNFTDQADVITDLGCHLSEALSKKLSNKAIGFKVQDQQLFFATIGKKKLATLSQTNSEERYIIRNKMGISVVVTGTFSLEKNLKMTYKIVEVGTGRVISTQSV